MRKAKKIAKPEAETETDLTSLPPPVAAKSPFRSIPKGWKPAGEALDYVRAVPTVFPDFNRATRVGGLPLRRITTVHGPTHGGKAFHVDTPVLTPTGWKRIGDVVMGDFVIGSDGAPTRVLGVYPQGKRELFEVAFSDGATTKCCAEHLWFTTTKKERSRGAYTRGPRPARVRVPTGIVGGGSVRDLATIMKDPPRTHEIPLVAPVQLEPRGELLLEPYLLGLLLGDGALKQGTIQFHKPELDLRAAVAELLPQGDSVSELSAMTLGVRGGKTLRAIRELGLEGARSWEKFIPDAYMFAAEHSRLALLRGLFDTDGHVHRKGNSRVEYSTTSPRLANQVVELVRGLGGIAQIQWRDTAYTKNGERISARPSARIDVWFQNGIVPVSSEKHLSRYGQGRDRVRRTIVGATPIGEHECVCIRVEASDSLYVAEDYIVTHNTAFIGGLIKSFVDAGHAAAYCDAEHATDLAFFDGIMGRPVREIPSFFGMRPDSYEETIDAIDDFLNSMIEERKSRRAAPGSPDDLAGIIVVDSINKLVPDRELAKLKKEGADAIDKGWGRYRAAMNQAWLDHVVPLINKAETALVIIAQERDEDQVEAWETPTPKGGKAVQYDASLICRISKSSPVRDGEGSDATTYGFKHKVRIWKSKVGHMDGRWSDCFFHVSNGALTPAGLDVTRDIIEVAKELEIITTAGSWVTYKKKRWQGTHRAVAALNSDPTTAAEIMSDIQSRIVKDAT